MTDIEPTEEWWAYGGIRLSHGERRFVWLPDCGNGAALVCRPINGRYRVGWIYQVLVTRAHGRVVMYGQPQYAKHHVDPDLAALLRAEHYAAHVRMALAGLKVPPISRVALDEAVEPVRAIARGLTGRADRAALLAHVVAELASALPTPAPYREGDGDG